MSELINGLDNWLDSRHQSDLDDRVSDESFGVDPGVEYAVEEEEMNSDNEEKSTVLSHVLDSQRQDVDRCPLCGHAPHPPTVCLNMASDSDCDCKGVANAERQSVDAPTDPLRQQIFELIDAFIDQQALIDEGYFITRRRSLAQFIADGLRKGATLCP